MISPIGSVQSQATAAASETTSAASQPSTSSSTASSSSATSVPVDTVTISSAAQAMLKEITETSAQTTKEANAGDHQAQRLLAKEAAEHSH